MNARGDASSKRETKGREQTKKSIIGCKMSATGNKASYRAGQGERGLEFVYVLGSLEFLSTGCMVLKYIR